MKNNTCHAILHDRYLTTNNMEIYFTREITVDLQKKLNFLLDLSDLFPKDSLGKSLDTIFVCLNSVDPEFGIWRDFETGLVVEKVFMKSKKNLEFGYKLNHKQMTEAQTREEVLAIVLEGFKKTYNEIKAMNIKDFDVDKFYSVVISTIEEFAKNEYVPKERIFIYQPERNKIDVSKDDKMSDRVFWEIIEQAKEESESFSDQVEVLIDKLSKLSEEQITGFEYTLREMLSKSAHYNILAAAKIISEHVSDDSFLYFRCRLMAEGYYLYFKAIENPDNIAQANVREIEFGGEEMLSVADQAFIRKNGNDADKELPRDIARDYHNYDEGEKILGTEWEEKDLSKRYPLLWNKYRGR